MRWAMGRWSRTSVFSIEQLSSIAARFVLLVNIESPRVSTDAKTVRWATIAPRGQSNRKYAPPGTIALKATPKENPDRALLELSRTNKASGKTCASSVLSIATLISRGKLLAVPVVRHLTVNQGPKNVLVWGLTGHSNTLMGPAYALTVTLTTHSMALTSQVKADNGIVSKL